MTRKQLNRFIRKVNHGENCKVVYYSGHDGGEWDKFSAYVEDNPSELIIHLNLSVWKDFWDSTKRQMICHEIGHYRSRLNKISKLDSVREYGAHRWAIHRCKELGMYRVARDLKKELQRWKTLKFTRYRLAYHIAKEKKLI